MKKRLTNINPLQCGIVLAALYFCLSLLFVPFLLLGMMMSAHASPAAQATNPLASLGLIFVVMIPVMYTVLGFIGGIIAALIYNLIAKMTGGLEFTTVDVAPALPPVSSYPTN